MPQVPGTAELTYSSYLELDRLLELQRPLSSPAHPDELLFIVTHQTMELWFKVMVHEVSRVMACLDGRAWTRAVARLRRVNTILVAQIAQMETLGHLDPAAFLGFRDSLGTASGFQSVQFRVLEVQAGFRQPEYLAELRAHNGGQLPEPIARALAEASLAELADELPGTTDAKTWAEVYADPEQHGDLFLLGEELLDHDRIWMRWRHEHLRLTERMLGPLARGTGGASSSYLERRVSMRIFPFLWDVRRQLISNDRESM
ncbi:MAG: tryptophan 23-dioxygenase [Actinomycetia bacterium]|nr:tryptophan 23-dioxygenase [Actinomycetes bacterium]